MYKNEIFFPESPVNYHKKRLASLLLCFINIGLHIIYGSLAQIISDDYEQNLVPALLSASIVYILLHIVGLIALFLEHHIWLKLYANLCVLTGTSSIVLMVELDFASLYWFVPVLSYLTAIMVLAFVFEVDAVRRSARLNAANVTKMKTYGTNEDL